MADLHNRGQHAPQGPHSLRSLAPLYLAFAASGVGVALPGVLLPVLLPQWHLRDAQGGWLLFMAWMGSSLGALLIRGSLRRLLITGCALVGLASAAVALCAGHVAGLWFALFGVGLGMVMTCVSLARQQQTGGSGTEMVRLNLVWAIGASLSPALMTRALQSGNDHPVLFGLAALFLLLALWCAARTELQHLAGAAATERPHEVLRRVPPALILMVMLITGVEASAGGWLATYARRGGNGVADTLAAPTCLWLGLLLSRLFWSVEWKAAPATIVRGELLLMAAAATAMLTGGRGWGLLTAAACLGFGIGPVYPLLLAWALKFHRGGGIFFLAGVGSALLPWITGIVSTAQGSLRMGLLVPALAVALMLVLALVSPIARWSTHTTLPSSITPSRG